MEWSVPDPQIFAAYLLEHGELVVPHLGKFTLSIHNGGTAIPPHSSESCEIPKHWRVHFRACRELREALQDWRVPE